MHFPFVDPVGLVADDLLIVRYMKIATFFMLTQGKVFIPSLKTIQRTDPTECGILSENYLTGSWIFRLRKTSGSFPKRRTLNVKYAQTGVCLPSSLQLFG